MATWQLRTYEVCGDAKNGYKVINVDYHGDIKLSDNPSDKKIKQAFGVRYQIKKYGDEVYIVVKRKRDGYPLGELIRNKVGYNDPL